MIFILIKSFNYYVIRPLGIVFSLPIMLMKHNYL